MAKVNGGFSFALKGNEEIPKKIFCWSDFEIISQKCSLSDLSQKLLAKF